MCNGHCHSTNLITSILIDKYVCIKKKTLNCYKILLLHFKIVKSAINILRNYMQYTSRK